MSAEAQRAAFEKANWELNFQRDVDAWGREIYAFSHVESIFNGWCKATEHAARLCESLSDDANNAQCADAIRMGE